MRRISCLVPLLLGLWLMAGQATAQEAAAPAPVDPAQLLESVRKDMVAVRATLEKPPGNSLDEAATLALRKRALSAQTRAQEAASALEPELAAVKARLAELGEPAAGVKESSEVASQRAQLLRDISSLDSSIKLARLLSLEAEQAAATALDNRRTQFSARLGERAPSPLGARFWAALGRDLPEDMGRARTLADDLRSRAATLSAGTWGALAGTLAVLLLVYVGGQRGLAHLSATRVPAGRLRRSLHALGVLLVRTLIPGLIVHAVVLALTAGPDPAALLMEWLEIVEAIVWFGAFVAGLGAALLMPRKPSWRLPPIPDAMAARLFWLPRTLAAVVVLGWVSTRTAAMLDASIASTWAVNGLAALSYMAVLGVALAQAQRCRGGARGGAGDGAGGGERDGSPESPSAPPRPLWWSTLRSIAWLALTAAAIALLAGFVTLGTFVMNQLVWGLIVLGTAYLVAVLVDDLFMSLLAPTPSHDGRGEGQDGAGSAGGAGGAHDDAVPAPRTREQTAVLLSALCRVVVAVFALVLLLAPYGEGPIELFRRAGRLHEGLSIGELSLRPMALVQGVLVVVLGFGLVRLLKEWLAQRYMPTTRMDAGMRLSVTTLFGYVGAIAVVAAAMSAVGVGLERVAWVASALSVGIGFGLQAVVQNFVSGIILLAERPVKVGDWVSLSGVEGDIRRINVRATEIQMGDRSTVIVPNSEFITKIVRNVTYADSLGMVQFKLPMPLATDTDRARALLLEAFAEHPGVLASPPPNVQLDGIDGTNFILNATGFVSSPRAAYGVKSDLLFDALARLRRAGLLPAAPAT